jgi:2-dehydro-3-deoxyphosphogluconate aldolase/(4S)-4-hydroxy-2-oxoglutarate aldolase
MNNALERILATRLVGIIRMKQTVHGAEIARALADGGLTCLEFTLSGDTASALAAISAARDAHGSAVSVGAGTVLDAAAARSAIAAGAEFLVTPAVTLDVIEEAQRADVPVLCGALTPTECLTAARAGASLVKLFPARLGGPAYLRDLLGPFPWLRLVPTGGVSPENARSFLDAGAVAVAMGGNLAPEQAILAGDWASLTRAARSAVAAVAAAE